ncbi:MOXD1 2 protein [Blattella germanica]|nr:MOXD1 2 protein [Blattella germanica]
MAWVLLALAVGLGQVTGAHWSHSAELDPNYTVFWTPGQEDITFEVQVRTLGYVGFGFSEDGKMPGADLVVGWVKDGTVFFQVSLHWTFNKILFYFILCLILIVYDVITQLKIRTLCYHLP